MKKYTRKEMQQMYQEGNIEISFKEILCRVKLMLSLIWNESHAIVFVKFACIILSTLSALISTLYLKFIIDALTSGNDIAYLFKLIVLIHILLLIIELPGRILENRIYPVMQKRVQCALKQKLMSTVMKKDLGNFEDRKFFEDNIITFAATDGTAFMFLDRIGSILSVLLSGASLIAIFASIDAYILLFVVAMLIVMTFEMQWGRLYNQLSFIEEQKISEMANYYQRIANDAEFAAEVRSYSMSDFIVRKFKKAHQKIIETYDFFLGKDENLKALCDSIINYVIQPALLIYLAYRVISGSMGIGSFSVAFSAAFTLNSSIFTLISACGVIKFQCCWSVERYIKVTCTNDNIETQNGPDKIHLPVNEIEEISFNNVYFKYPRHSEIVINNMNFTLTKGKKIAIVGRNGVGKTTLVKLLLRLYDVDSGEILINGRNIREYNISDIRRSFSMILQDFHTYQMTIAENVMLDEYSGNSSDKNSLFEALHFSDMDEKVNRMKHKENSMVGRLFDDEGEALSGGEKQRLAIARGYLRAKNADIFILDEPNSALDPISEYELNKKIMSVLNDKIVIFITHRLSTTVLADEILYIEDGQIVERGTHDELINTNGKYADMFNKQAEAYRLETQIKRIDSSL